MPTATAAGQPPEEMPIWARLRLAEQAIPFRRVTHWSRRGDVINAAVAGQPVRLRKHTPAA